VRRMRERPSLVLTILLAACVVAFPVGYFYPFGAPLDISSSRDGLVQLIRGIAERFGLTVDQNRDAADVVTIKTYYLEYRSRENPRRQYRVAYVLKVTQKGSDRERHQVLAIDC